MNWPEAMVAIAAMVCGVSLTKTVLRFLAGKLR